MTAISYHSGSTQHTCQIPLIGQYLCDFVLNFSYTPYPCPIVVTLVVNGWDVASVFINGMSKCLLGFFTTNYLFTEALYNCQSIYIRFDFHDSYIAKHIQYQLTYKVGYVNDEIQRNLLKYTNHIDYSTYGYLCYYDGLLWYA